jgi:hypothetical protein
VSHLSAKPLKRVKPPSEPVEVPESEEDQEPIVAVIPDRAAKSEWDKRTESDTSKAPTLNPVFFEEGGDNERHGVYFLS